MALARRCACAVLLIAALHPLVACNGDDAMACDPPVASDGGATELPSDVDDILERRCRPCHSDPTQMYAPMPLVTWEHVHAPRPAPNDDEAVFEAIARRIHDERFPMPPKTFRQLDDDELSRLDEWLSDCAPPAGDR
jgi:uncharacterized membrane protein